MIHTFRKKIMLKPKLNLKLNLFLHNLLDTINSNTVKLVIAITGWYEQKKCFKVVNLKTFFIWDKNDKSWVTRQMWHAPTKQRTTCMRYRSLKWSIRRFIWFCYPSTFILKFIMQISEGFEYQIKNFMDFDTLFSM